MRKYKIQKGLSPLLSLIPEKSACFQSTEQLLNFNEQKEQEQMYHKIKSFIIKSNRQSGFKSQKKREFEQTQIKSHQVLVRSQQQKQLMSYLGPRVLPILVQSPIINQKGRRKRNSHSVLDNILSDRQQFKKTYFADLKNHRKNGNKQQISYIFPQINMKNWQLNGYIKGKYILIKATSKKGRSIIKKYLYSDVCSQIRKNYQNWLKNHIIIDIQELDF